MSRASSLFALLLLLGCGRAPEQPARESDADPRDSAPRKQETAGAEAPAPACGRVAFVETDADERSRVWIMPATGGPATPLSAAPLDPEGSSFPVAQSPDGARLLLLSSREADEGIALARLWLAALDDPSVAPRPLALPEQPLRSPSWAPDGRWLVFESAANSFRDLYRVELESGAVLRLTDDPQGNFEPAVSPDGQAIAFVSSRDGDAEIYAMSSDGGDPRRLTTSPGDDSGPRWAPDGRTIAFCSARERARGVDVFVMDPDGQRQRPLIERPAGGDTVIVSQLEFSPDGSRLAFTELTPGRGIGAIVVVALERGEVVARIAGEGVSEQPSWSPDGHYLLFTRSAGEGSILVRARADGSEIVELGEPSRQRWLPRWLADPACPRVNSPMIAAPGSG